MRRCVLQTPGLRVSPTGSGSGALVGSSDRITSGAIASARDGDALLLLAGRRRNRKHGLAAAPIPCMMPR